MKILIFSFLIAIIFFGCDKPALTPARKLEGTWTTPFPVNFYLNSDGCGSYSPYAKFTMKLKWTITAISDSFINVRWDLTGSTNPVTIGSNCGQPNPTIVFPLEFVGVISGSRIALSESQMAYSSTGAALGLRNVLVGLFSFTTDNITGTMFEKDCPVYCSGYSTDSMALIVQRN
jgi:hypothetical protein